KEEETCDLQVEKIIKALDRTFITPFDREDIHTLATKLDDILDHMEETSHRFEVFRLKNPRRPPSVSPASSWMPPPTSRRPSACAATSASRTRSTLACSKSPDWRMKPT